MDAIFNQNDIVMPERNFKMYPKYTLTITERWDLLTLTPMGLQVSHLAALYTHVVGGDPQSPQTTCWPSPIRLATHSTAPGLWVGIEMDVWKSELSEFESAKNINMDIRIRIRN